MNTVLLTRMPQLVGEAETVERECARAAGDLIHALAEVEIVFALWAAALVTMFMAIEGPAAAIRYVESRNFTEPMFVFAIMVIAGTRPVLQFAMFCVKAVARFIPLPASMAHYFVVLSLVPNHLEPILLLLN